MEDNCIEVQWKEIYMDQLYLVKGIKDHCGRWRIMRRSSWDQCWYAVEPVHMSRYVAQAEEEVAFRLIPPFRPYLCGNEMIAA